MVHVRDFLTAIQHVHKLNKYTSFCHVLVPVTFITCSLASREACQLVQVCSIGPAYLHVFWLGAWVEATSQSSSNFTSANDQRQPVYWSISKQNSAETELGSAAPALCCLPTTQQMLNVLWNLSSFSCLRFSKCNKRFTNTFGLVNIASSAGERSLSSAKQALSQPAIPFWRDDPFPRSCFSFFCLFVFFFQLL